MTTSLKVSFIWTRTFFQLFDNSCIQNSPYDFFVKPSAYKDKIKSLYTDESSLTLPWKLTGKNNLTNWFWKYYLNDIDPLSAPHETIANRCYPLYVPVRKSLTKQITVNWPSSGGSQNRGSFEGFFYRHGVAVVCTFSVHGCTSLKDAVEQGMSLRHDPLFSIPSTTSNVALTTVGDFCRNLLSEEIKVVTDWFDEEPFSLVTVVEGELNQEAQQGDSIQRALEALACWDKTWEKRELPVLSDHTISMKNNHAADIMYGHANSRVLWIPRLFIPGNNYALFWYSRNLLMATMQVKSFRDFLVRAADADRIKPGDRLGGYARQIGEIIRNMEKGLKTYRTLSAYRQIQDDKKLQAVLSAIS